MSPYAALGLPEGASQRQVKSAYRRLLRDSHPDLGGSTEQFTAIRTAFELLSDPVRRAAYDAGHRSAPDPPPSTSAASAAWGTEDVWHQQDPSGSLPDRGPAPSGPASDIPTTGRWTRIAGWVSLAALVELITLLVLRGQVGVEGLALLVYPLMAWRVISTGGAQVAFAAVVLLILVLGTSTIEQVDTAIAGHRALTTLDLALPALALVSALSAIVASEGVRRTRMTRRRLLEQVAMRRRWEQVLSAARDHQGRLWWVLLARPAGPQTEVLLEDPSTGDRHSGHLWGMVPAGVWIVVDTSRSVRACEVDACRLAWLGG